MNLLRRPISASDRIPDRFWVINMEFLSLSRRSSSSRNVPQRRWARRNVCRAKASDARAKLLFCTSKALSTLMRFQKYAFSLTLATRRLISVHTTVLMRFRLSILGTLRSNDSDGNDNVKKSMALISNDNNFARASRFIVHFFPVFARLRR